MRNEWKDLSEKLLFDFGKAVLGKNSGGMIAMLIKDRGIDAARNAIKAAGEKENPREYIGAVLRDDPGGSVKAKIGEQIGKAYLEWQSLGGKAMTDNRDLWEEIDELRNQIDKLTAAIEKILTYAEDHDPAIAVVARTALNEQKP